jgi:hypothetical protein
MEERKRPEGIQKSSRRGSEGKSGWRSRIIRIRILGVVISCVVGGRAAVRCPCSVFSSRLSAERVLFLMQCRCDIDCVIASHTSPKKPWPPWGLDSHLTRYRTGQDTLFALHIVMFCLLHALRVCIVTFMNSH